jgi:phosphohistidine swiveling domain-containing protein
MGWSIFDGVFFPHIFTDVFRFPIDYERYYKYRPVELLSGRLYWNVNNTMAFAKPIGRILDFIRGGEAIDPQFAAAFDAVDRKNLPHVLSPFRMRMFTIVSSWRLMYFVMLGFFRYRWMSQKIRKAYAAFNRVRDDLVPAHNLKVGLQNIEAWFEIILKKFTRRYFGGLCLSVFYLALLSIVLSLRMGKRGELLARKTIVGILDKTGEMVLAINELSRLARKKVKNLTTRNLKSLYKKDNIFRRHFDRFIKEFGHRGPAEFDIASPNWFEDYDMVFQLLSTTQHTEGNGIDRAQLIRDMLSNAKPFERFLLKVLIPRIEVFTPFRENGKHIYLKLGMKIKEQLLVMARILQKRGFLKSERDIFFLTLPDIAGIRDGTHAKAQILKRVRVRKKQWDAYRRTEAADIIYETGERITTAVVASTHLAGESLSFGKVTARARLIRNFDESHKLRKGDILVTHHTDPGWTPLFTTCSGVVIEVGGLICHAAMVARELGVPAVVVRGATSLIPDGATIELDADNGTVKILQKAKQRSQKVAESQGRKV